MATAVQIEVRVDDNATNASLGKIGTSIKQLQADVTTATKNLADAQLQLGKAAEQGNAQARAAIQQYQAELAKATQALEAYRAAEAEAAAATETMTEAVTHQVPQMAAASAAVRLLEGNTTGSIRAAERFLSTTLNLGPALQAAFPVFGALAFLGVIEHVADVTSKFFADLFIYTESAKQAYAGQVAANNALATAQEHLKEAAAELFTTTHSAQENIQHDIDQETQKRNLLIDQLTRQRQKVDELAAATRNFTTFSQNTAIFNQYGGSFSAAKSALDVEKANRDALAQEVDAMNDRIATSDAKLDDQIAKDDDELRRKREENLRAYNEVLKQKQEEAKRLWDQYNRDIDEQDKIFNSLDLTIFKQGQQEQEQELHRHDQAVIAEVKQNAKDVQQAQQQFAQQQKTLANDLFQTFNDITSGHISKLITDGFKRLFANILASWLMTIDGIRNANLGSNGAGGLLGALLGSVFGIGTGGAGAGSANSPYGLPAGVAMSFGDEFGGLTAADFGYSPIGGGRTDPYSLGGGSLTTSVAGAALGPILAPTPVGGGTTGASKSGIGALFSGSTLAKLFPAAVLGSLLLGAKGGNSAIAGGALIGALGLGALYGPSATLTAAAAPFAPFLGPLAGGLIGFGVGSQYGPAPGALSGAASGAGIGFLAGGPIGAAIGGIIGGLVGLFSGLFGGGPSKHDQADKYINSNVLPLIQQELTNYEGFRTDYATAINDLEQLKQQSYDQMRQQFGKDATNDEWNKLVVPAIGTAEDRIRTDEAERQRRGTLVFGAPQFAEGGTFTSGYGPGGAGVAILHNFERVMTRAATSMYGPELAAMEASAKAGVRVSASGGSSFTIVAWDGASVEKWLRNGGAAMISNAQARRRLEGHS